MEKFKIEEISSKEYEQGRVDRFSIYKRIDLHNQLISFLRSLDFSEEKLEELDFVTSNIEGYFFVFDKNIRFHMFISVKEITFVLDTNFPKEKIISKLEKYFHVLE